MRSRQVIHRFIEINSRQYNELFGYLRLGLEKALNCLVADFGLTVIKLPTSVLEIMTAPNFQPNSLSISSGNRWKRGERR